MKFIKKTLGEIETLLKTGKTPPSKDKRYYEGNINWYTPGDLDNEKYLSKSNRTITEEALNEGKATLFPRNSVLIGCIGDIGKLGITSEESSSNQQLTAIQTNNEVYYEYLFYYLKSNKQLLQKLSKNAIVPILNNSNLRKLKISYPESIRDQKRIAQVLSNCETLIQKRKESIALLDELLKSTFLDMFGDPVRNEKKLKFVSLAKYGDFKNGLNYSRNEVGLKVRYLGVGDFKKHNRITNMHILKEISLSIKPSEDYFLKDGDLVFVRSNGNKELVGRCVVVNPKKEKVTFSGFCIRFRPKSKDLNTLYLSHLFTIDNFKKRMLQSGRGANIQNINQKLLGELKIPLPEPKLQEKFVNIVEKVETIKQHYQTHLQELENLYGSISQKVFKGELDLTRLILKERILPPEVIEGVEHLNDQDEDFLHFDGAGDIINNPFTDSKDKNPNSITDDSYFENKSNKIQEDDNDGFTLNELIKITKGSSAKKEDEDYDIGFGGDFFKKKEKGNIASTTEPKTRLGAYEFHWDEVSAEKIARIIKSRYSDNHFSMELLRNYIEKKKRIEIAYYSSEELKKKPELNRKQDLKKFIFSAIEPQDKDDPNPFLSLNQHFYDAVNENFDLKLLSSDYTIYKEKDVYQRSGIYFTINK